MTGILLSKGFVAQFGAELQAAASAAGVTPRIIHLPDDATQRLPAAEIAHRDGTQLTRDAVSALVNLGYRRADAEQSVREIARNGEGSLGEVLKEALRRLSQ